MTQSDLDRMSIADLYAANKWLKNRLKNWASMHNHSRNEDEKKELGDDLQELELINDAVEDSLFKRIWR